MRNYLNSTEQSTHLVVIASTTAIKDLIDSNGVTDEEKAMLRTAYNKLMACTSSIFGRLGEGYKRSIENKARLNRITLISRNFATARKETAMEDILDTSEVRELLKQCSLECSGCTRTDLKNCPIYQMNCYLNTDGKSEDNDLCPFRQAEIKLEEIEF